jgi:hypothetical protein
VAFECSTFLFKAKYNGIHPFLAKMNNNNNKKKFVNLLDINDYQVLYIKVK